MTDPDAIADTLAPEVQTMLVGHQTVRSALRAQLAAGRLPGAVLLHGPQGIGKATLAFTLARDILTATGDEDAHRVDEQVAAGAHPNLAVLRRRPRDGKGFYTVIRVEDVRELRNELHMTRGRAGHRVAIVDPIDDCNPNAANALLKTLEEPPPETTFLLVSHRPGQLLPTIHSRCHSLALRALGDADVSAVLTAQRADAGGDEIARAVGLARGRPRRGFEALALSPESVLGGLQTWLRAPLQHPSASHLALADAIGADRDGPDLSFARELLNDWLAEEARAAAISGERMRLASAGELWEKADALFAETDALNLDMRQTLVTIFDAIRKHVQTTSSPATQQ
ncbi:AAA family ATPase [Devosia geojensis]|uniref:AAA family ATPase n=1 Tax=Devosia geojensis TaxID=443610 RepID=UPI0006971B2A|nr:AAA family ATPase [Devosia geojensis]